MQNGRPLELKNTRAKLAEQLTKKEEEIDELQSRLRKNCEKIIELENLLSRFQAVASGNIKENEAIAKASYARSKVNRKKHLN